GAGQTEIADDHVRSQAKERLEALERRARGGDGGTLQLEDAAQRLLRVRVIFDDEQPESSERRIGQRRVLRGFSRSTAFYSCPPVAVSQPTSCRREWRHLQGL